MRRLSTKRKAVATARTQRRLRPTARPRRAIKESRKTASRTGSDLKAQLTATAGSGAAVEVKPRTRRLSVKQRSVRRTERLSPPAKPRVGFVESERVGGPGERFAVGPAVAPVVERRRTPSGPPASLPVSYGTGRLMLMARDPRWLYAQWDASPGQVSRLASLPKGTKAHLRIHVGDAKSKPIRSVPLVASASARCSWFVEVDRCDETYVAEVGYEDSTGTWISIVTSSSIRTPPASRSAQTTYSVATIHPEAPIAVAISPVSADSAQGQRAESRAPLHAPSEMAATEMSVLGSGWPESVVSDAGSLSSQSGAFGSGAFAAMPRMGPSSAGLAWKPSAESRGFWLAVNAELVIYGATEPTASLTVAGRPVALRPDGSFSLRFALPDGEYEMAVEAKSAGGRDRRGARMRFRRKTESEGQTKAAQPREALDPPASKRRED